MSVLVLLLVLVMLMKSMEMLSRSMVSWEGIAVDASTGWSIVFNALLHFVVGGLLIGFPKAN